MRIVIERDCILGGTAVQGGIVVKFDEKIASLMEGFTPKQLLMLAGVAGLLTFFLLYWGLSHLIGKDEQPDQPQTSTVKMVKVVQAKTDIKEREQLKDSMLQLVEVPASMLPEGALTEIQGLAGRPTRVAILAGDILTERKIYKDIKDSGFTGIIPPDRRAMSIAVTDVTGVSGFIKPGDYVDVMFITEKMDSTRITGEVILQNVMLLGVNSTADRAEEQGKEAGSAKGKTDAAFGGKPMTATLAVRPEEELRLAVAAHAGQLYLALRPYKPTNKYMIDTEYSFFKGRATNTTPSAAPAPSYAPSSEPRSAPSTGSSSDPGRQMEIIRGTKASRGQ